MVFFFFPSAMVHANRTLLPNTKVDKKLHSATYSPKEAVLCDANMVTFCS